MSETADNLELALDLAQVVRGAIAQCQARPVGLRSGTSTGNPFDLALKALGQLEEAIQAARAPIQPLKGE